MVAGAKLSQGSRGEDVGVGRCELAGADEVGDRIAAVAALHAVAPAEEPEVGRFRAGGDGAIEQRQAARDGANALVRDRPSDDLLRAVGQAAGERSHQQLVGALGLATGAASEQQLRQVPLRRRQLRLERQRAFEGSARFGFTTGWRRLVEARDPQGVVGQLLLLGLAATLSESAGTRRAASSRKAAA